MPDFENRLPESQSANGLAATGESVPAVLVGGTEIRAGKTIFLFTGS
jgi:hypothetical protein